ncbi:MAG: histidinol-phosphatase [Rhodobacteraceae bacterium]|nr:histidinol-phosphatase [Paracoccaceae bacterium]
MTDADDDMTSDLSVANVLAAAARTEILPLFRAGPGLSAENKLPSDRGFDPVTAADRAAETAMRRLLAEHRPRDGVYGEEFGRVDGESGRLWVLDPIDGTRAFISGLLHWGVLIALLNADKRPILGVMDQPYTNERFSGCTQGRSTTVFSHNAATTQLAVRSCPSLADAVMLTTDPDLFAEGAERNAFEALSGRVRLRRFGSDCYGYAMLAAGCVDLVVETGLSPYDIQALIPIVEASGGVVTDWQGGANPWGGRVLAAGDRRVHAEALELLSQTP